MGCNTSKSSVDVLKQIADDSKNTSLRGQPSHTKPIVASNAISNTSTINVSNYNANQDGQVSTMDNLTIIHFNDVYNIEARDTEPVGGASRFITKVKEYVNEKPLIFFSGDCLNPSLMSTVTKGKQMIPVLRGIGVHAALYGNHDFDFGVDELLEFKNATMFPWLLSNAIDNLTGDFLADGVERLLLDWQGRKVGVMGLIEEEWLATLATVDSSDVVYHDYVDVARRLATELRNEGAELVIALTHMRIPNDLRLLQSDADIDLILGGHDHHYEIKQGDDGKTLVKSGSDFKEFSRILVKFDDNSNRPLVVTHKVEVTSDIEEDAEMKKTTEEFLALIEDKMDTNLGNIRVDLDGRFSVVRTGESNLGNFISDIMRMATQVDAALLNGGSLRSDMVHPAGPFSLKDLLSILPMMDTLVVLAVPGEVLIDALENGVSQYPKHEGRFPQVSGINFSFNPDQPPGQRVVKNSVKVNGQPIDWKYEYSVCVKLYLANGKDGYEMFRSCRKIISEENGQILPTIVQNHFESLKMISGLRKSISGHKQSVVMHEDHGLAEIIEKERCKLSPKIEGRINIISYNNEKQNAAVAPRSSSPKPNRRVTRMKSVTAPPQSLMGLTEDPAEDVLTHHSPKNETPEYNDLEVGD
eukprot:gene18960-20866_t